MYIKIYIKNVFTIKYIQFLMFTELEAILFLHSNYYKMEATKTAIEAYFTLRSTVPMFFTKRSAQEPGTKRAMNTL